MLDLLWAGKHGLSVCPDWSVCHKANNVTSHVRYLNKGRAGATSKFSLVEKHVYVCCDAVAERWANTPSCLPDINSRQPVGWKGVCSLTVPTSGNRKPEPTLARMSLMGRTNPVGTPFLSASWESDKWVFAMQMGRLLKPWGGKEGKQIIMLYNDSQQSKKQARQGWQGVNVRSTFHRSVSNMGSSCGTL